jgi:sphingomyelin phosphodiesterase acid-like 3
MAALRILLLLAVLLLAVLLPASSGLPTPNRTGARWLVMTDIHYDPFYATSRAVNSRDTNCSSPTAAPFGQFGCDSPWALVKSMMVAAHAEEPNPEAILMLGDFTRHDMKQLENPTAIIQEIWQNVSALAASLCASGFPPPAAGRQQ